MDVYRRAAIAFGVSLEQLNRFKWATRQELSEASDEMVGIYRRALEFLDDLKIVMDNAPSSVRDFLESEPRFDGRIIDYVTRWAREIRDSGGDRVSSFLVKCHRLRGSAGDSEEGARSELIRTAISMVACVTGVPGVVILGGSRGPQVTRARHIAMYLAYILGGDDVSTLDIGDYFGRDHSTVVYAIKKVKGDPSLMREAMDIARMHGLYLADEGKEAA